MIYFQIGSVITVILLFVGAIASWFAMDPDNVDSDRRDAAKAALWCFGLMILAVLAWPVYLLYGLIWFIRRLTLISKGKL